MEIKLYKMGSKEYFWNEGPKKITEIESKCTLMMLINHPLSDRQGS